jgi:hypothetical protein
MSHDSLQFECIHFFFVPTEGNKNSSSIESLKLSESSSASKSSRPKSCFILLGVLLGVAAVEGADVAADVATGAVDDDVDAFVVLDCLRDEGFGDGVGEADNVDVGLEAADFGSGFKADDELFLDGELGPADVGVVDDDLSGDLATNEANEVAAV